MHTTASTGIFLRCPRCDYHGTVWQKSEVIDPTQPHGVRTIRTETECSLCHGQRCLRISFINPTLPYKE